MVGGGGGEGGTHPPMFFFFFCRHGVVLVLVGVLSYSLSSFLCSLQLCQSAQIWGDLALF